MVPAIERAAAVLDTILAGGFPPPRPLDAYPAVPRLVEAVVYDAATDLAGSAVTEIKM